MSTDKPGFHLPWIHTPEEQAARAQEKQRAADLANKTQRDFLAAQVRQNQDLQLLQRGGIPTQATERLQEISTKGHEGVIFTSDIAPEEAALLRREGFKVLGLVTGSAIYHVGQAYASAYNSCEVTVLSDAYNACMALAVNRLEQELKLIGAHGVVGVRLSLVRHEWADKSIEVQVIGTAVTGPGLTPATPWMCDLSGQEWYALHRAGYQPAGLVWGHCTWFVLTTQSDEWIKQTWSNSEFPQWSTALSNARHRAMAHLVADARHRGATGVAGVRVERRLDEVRLSGMDENPAYEREHHNLVLSIIGTAIKIRPDAPAGVTPTVQVLSLRDGRMAAVAIDAKDTHIE